MNRIGMLALTAMVLTGCGAPPSETSSVAPQNMSAPVRKAPEVNHLNAGIQSLQKGDVRAAILSFDEAIKADPIQLEGYMILGETYMRMNEYARAVDTYTAATRVAPDQGELYYLLALNYGLMGDKISARNSIEKSIEIFRNNQDEDNFLKAVAFLQGMVQAEEAEGAVAATEAPAVESGSAAVPQP